MVVTLDGSLIPNRAALHDLLQDRLALPAYYGRNLDALYDLLTERTQPLVFVISDYSVLEVQLGRYAAALLKTLQDAAAVNPNLSLRCE